MAELINISQKIAVLIPCFNEEVAIEKVVNDFKVALPNARIYVFDNCSTDNTRKVAKQAGAIVRNEPQKGKGNVVRRMFADIEAEVYVMVDGDDTYDAQAAPMLISHMIENQLDMVNAKRTTKVSDAYRPGHRLGNRMLTWMISVLFGNQFDDLLSGYRVFSRRFVKSFPSLSSGFEIETELTVHALELRMPIGEVSTNYKERPEGSVSKLKTYRDGIRILKTISNLVRGERPLEFFSVIGFLLVSVSLILSVPLLITYLETGLVPRFPTAILATGLILLGFLSFACGLILDTVTRGRQESKRMSYLQVYSRHLDEPETMDQ